MGTLGTHIGTAGGQKWPKKGAQKSPRQQPLLKMSSFFTLIIWGLCGDLGHTEAQLGVKNGQKRGQKKNNNNHKRGNNNYNNGKNNNGKNRNGNNPTTTTKTTTTSRATTTTTITTIMNKTHRLDLHLT